MSATLCPSKLNNPDIIQLLFKSARSFCSALTSKRYFYVCFMNVLNYHHIFYLDEMDDNDPQWTLEPSREEKKSCGDFGRR